jgi:hypothetical protein
MGLEHDMLKPFEDALEKKQAFTLFLRFKFDLAGFMGVIDHDQLGEDTSSIGQMVSARPIHG